MTNRTQLALATALILAIAPAVALSQTAAKAPAKTAAATKSAYKPPRLADGRPDKCMWDNRIPKVIPIPGPITPHPHVVPSPSRRLPIRPLVRRIIELNEIRVGSINRLSMKGVRFHTQVLQVLISDCRGHSVHGCHVTGGELNQGFG